MFLLNATPPIFGPNLAGGISANASVNGVNPALSESLDGLDKGRSEFGGVLGGVGSGAGRAVDSMGSGVGSMLGGVFGGAGKGAAKILRALIGLLQAIAGLQKPPSPQPTATSPSTETAGEGTENNNQNPLAMIISLLERLASKLESDSRNNPASTEGSSQPGSGSSIPEFGPPGIGPEASPGPAFGGESPVFGSGAANTDLGSGGSSLPGLEVPVGGGRNIPPQGPM